MGKSTPLPSIEKARKMNFKTLNGKVCGTWVNLSLFTSKREEVIFLNEKLEEKLEVRLIKETKPGG